MKVLPKEEVLKLVRSKAMSPKEAMEALRPEPEESDTLSDIKKLLSDAIGKFQAQNEKLINIAKADLAKPEGAEAVINALQLQTKDIINSLKKLEGKAEEKKTWTISTSEIERGRDGRVVKMEVVAEQS